MSKNRSCSINPADVHYVIDKERRKVICYVNGTSKNFIKFAQDNLGYGILYDPKLYDKLLMKNRYTGIATCSEDDNWNEDYGKLLAYHRMRDKITKAFFKRGQIFTDYLSTTLDDFIYSVNTYGEKLYNNFKRRESIIKGESEQEEE